MRRSEDFSETVRRGVRSGRPSVVVHLLSSAARATTPTSDQEPTEPVLVGFVVPRAVGGAVVRNRVKRRLRSMMAGRLAELPAGSRIVVRALGPAREAAYGELETELAAALGSALHKESRRRPAGAPS